MKIVQCKKRACFKLFVILNSIFLSMQILSHGFGSNTLVKSATQGWRIIGSLCNERNYKDHEVLSYDANLTSCVNRRIKCAGESETNCYFRIVFDEWFNDDILCTPSQEFYSPLTKTWVFAYTLKVGNVLLGASNELKTITHIEFVKKPLQVYSLEIEGNTHNFFVGRHSILTHNMLLPALTASLGVSFGSGAAVGGTTGGFFGPIGFAGGIVVGGVIGVAIKLFSNNSTAHYQLVFNAGQIDEYRSFQNKDNDAQAPGMPTENDGFVPPKKWDGKKVKSRRGFGWPDKDGNIWVPTGPNGHGGPHWDVQLPKGGYKNVLPGGKIRGQK